ncbi:glycosyltransferase family 9 protein [Bacteroidota bacterium]
MNLENVNKLLIVRLSSLGDILLTTPFLRSIKIQFPNIDIDFVLREEYRDLLKLNPHLNQILSFSNISGIVKGLNEEISKNNYDLVIDLQNNLRSKQLLRQIRTIKLVFNKRNINKFLLVYFNINRLREPLSIPERYTKTIDGLTLDGKGPDLYTANKPNLVLSDDSNLIGFCPGSKHYTKMWPVEYFISLGKILHQNDYKVVLFGGSDDRQICEYISSKLTFAINLCNDNDILQTAADMKMCKTIYCNDSGLMHTASAVNIPIIAFYGSTVKEFGFAPYNSKHLILENNSLSCRPCTHIGRRNCPKKHFDCMKKISSQTAFDALRLSINK